MERKLTYRMSSFLSSSIRFIYDGFDLSSYSIESRQELGELTVDGRDSPSGVDRRQLDVEGKGRNTRRAKGLQLS